MSGDNDFELPDIDDSWLDGHEVLDDEHPIYTDYDTDDYNNEEYEDIDEVEQPALPPVRRRKKMQPPQRESSTEKPRRKKPTKKRKSAEEAESPRPKKRRTHNTPPPPPLKKKPARRVEPEEEYYDYDDDYGYGSDDYSVDYEDDYNDYTDGIDDNDGNDNMHVDKKTGVSYELLPGSDKAAVTAYKKSKGAGLTLEQMFAYTDMADDFDGMDLSASASRFLPHMQVPISREEREAAREKLRRSAQRNKERNARKYAVRKEEDNRDTPEGAMGNPKKKRRKPRKRPR